MTNARKEEIRGQLNLYMEDEAFLTAVLSAGEPEKIAAAMQEKGIGVDAAEIAELMQEGLQQMETLGEEGELSEEQLNEVSGGGKLRAAVTYAGVLVGGVVIGAGLGVFAGVGVITVGTAYAIGAGYALIGGAATISASKSKKKKKK